MWMTTTSKTTYVTLEDVVIVLRHPYSRSGWMWSRITTVILLLMLYLIVEVRSGFIVANIVYHIFMWKYYFGIIITPQFHCDIFI